MQQLDTTPPAAIINRDTADYEKWNNRDANLRVKGNPSAIIPVKTTEELVLALQETVDKKKGLAVRCGGHCLENFVTDPEIAVVIDISLMKGIRFDAAMNAYEIMAGNTLGEVHEKLYNEWGLFLPSGEHPAIGMGGHIPGGAFGFFCRKYGLGVDYLYAVEVVSVNHDRKVITTIATSEKNDPNRQLWWAHTGGGAGNFGIVTRYWFRALPEAPAFIETAELEWDWKNTDQAGFQQLVANFGNWCMNNSHPEDSANTLFATLHCFSPAVGKIQLKAVLCHQPAAGTLLRELMDALAQAHHIPVSLTRKKLRWLDFVLHPFPDIFTDARAAFKVKDALLLQPFTPEQINTAYTHLTTGQDTPGAFIGMASYGCQVNSVEAFFTAAVQRNAIMDIACSAGWQDAAEEKKYLDWVRNCYRDLFANTGGVPVPGDTYGGCLIAHPDNDLANTAWNKSGLPWHAFYYPRNYPLLQAVKQAWDPNNIFRHALSVQPGNR